jgi:hypothetical protein
MTLLDLCNHYSVRSRYLSHIPNIRSVSPNIPAHGVPRVGMSRNTCCILDSSTHLHVHSEIRNIKVIVLL